jgi:hypothetical protein
MPRPVIAVFFLDQDVEEEVDGGLLCSQSQIPLCSDYKRTRCCYKFSVQFHNNFCIMSLTPVNAAYKFRYSKKL